MFYIAIVISSLGSTATGQFGSLGVSWNSGAPPISSNSPPPPPPSYFSAPGDKGPAHRHLERNKTPDDDLGLCHDSYVIVVSWK